MRFFEGNFFHENESRVTLRGFAADETRNDGREEWGIFIIYSRKLHLFKKKIHVGWKIKDERGWQWGGDKNERGRFKSERV